MGYRNHYKAPEVLSVGDLNTLEAITFDDFMKGKPDVSDPSWTMEQLERLCAIKRILDDREQNYGILYYKPQPHQVPFHSSLKKIRMVLGGNQSGKTHCSVAEGIQLSLGIHPYRKMKVPNRGRVIGTDLDKGIGEVIGPKYDKFLPKTEVARITRYPGGQYKKIYWKNGSTTEFLSYEQDTKLFEGWTGDWVQFDEPPPQDKYIACLRGLMRFSGILWIAATPLDQPWIYDDIYLKAGPDPSQPDVFNFDITDNKHLSAEEIKIFMDNIPEDEREARLHGKFRHLSGLVYKDFSQVHRIKSFEIPEDWPLYMAMDYHPRTPCAVLWAAVDPHDTVYLVDELWINNSTISEIAQGIIAKEKEYKNKVVARWIDSLAATPERTSGKSTQREFLEQGIKLKHPLNFRSSLKEWSLGKNTVQEYLRLKNGVPGVYFFEDKTQRCIHGFTHYLWDEYSGVKQGTKESPQKKYAHFPDTARYILVMRPKYRKALPQEGQDYLDRKENEAHKYTGYSFGG